MPTIESTVEAPATTTETNGHAPKAAKVKKAAKAKAPAKKATAKVKKAPKAKKEPKGPRGPSKTQINVLKALNKKGELSRVELADQLETFIGGDIMGHADPKKIKPNSLVGRGLVRMKGGEPRKLADGSFSETEGAHVYEITAAGKKALEATK